MGSGFRDLGFRVQGLGCFWGFLFWLESVIQGHFIERVGSEGPLYRDKVVEILIIQNSIVSVKVCHALRAAERHKHE